MFQFYSSSIKAKGHTYKKFIVTLFQFYSSSIKAPIEKVKEILKASFNSIVVRLKLDWRDSPEGYMYVSIL